MTVGVLGIHHVVEPLSVKLSGVEIEKACLHIDAAVVHPAHFLPLRAIGWDAVEVVEIGPNDEVLDLVQSPV